MQPQEVIERPILFSVPMVRALLAGLKTRTIRPITRANSCVNGWPSAKKAFWESLDFSRAWVDPGPSPLGNPGPYLKVPRIKDGEETVHRVYPRVQVGTRLWVREHVRICGSDMDGAPLMDPPVYYMADGPCPDPEAWPFPRPAIHMPRWASRITLEVTSVRVERVQDISEEDAIAEGWDSISDKKRGCSWNEDPWVWVLTFKVLEINGSACHAPAR